MLSSRVLSSSLRSALLPSVLRTTVSVPPIQARQYHERVIDHYERPRNVGSLPKDSPNVGTGVVGAPACGYVICFFSISESSLYTVML